MDTTLKRHLLTTGRWRWLLWQNRIRRGHRKSQMHLPARLRDGRHWSRVRRHGWVWLYKSVQERRCGWRWWRQKHLREHFWRLQVRFHHMSEWLCSGRGSQVSCLRMRFRFLNNASIAHRTCFHKAFDANACRKDRKKCRREFDEPNMISYRWVTMRKNLSEGGLWCALFQLDNQNVLIDSFSGQPCGASRTVWNRPSNQVQFWHQREFVWWFD